MKNHEPKRIVSFSSMTRRQVLQGFGMLGTSSLMMGAMSAWDLMGEPAGPKPILQGTHPGTKVIILGAGLSGLIIAYELGKLGYDCRILEARNQVGGLTWTVRGGDSHTELGEGEHQVCQYDEDLYFNAGAWRIPNADKGIIDYCAELGVSLELFVNSSDANYLYQEDPSKGQLAKKKVRLGEIKADLWGSTNELLAKALDQGQIDAPLSEEDKELLIEFLVNSGYLDSADYVYRPPAIRGSQERYDLAALLQSGFGNSVRSLVRVTGGPDPVFQPIGGMQKICFAFAEAIGDGIILGSEVQKITQTDDVVRVVYKDTETGQEYEETADYCACCLPMSILKKININLSPEMATVVANSEHSSSAKMGLQMKRRFWEEDDGIFGGHIFGRSLQIGEFSYPSNDYFTKKGILLGFYADGTIADLENRPVQERIDYVLQQASKVHPQMREEFESAYCVWWDKIKYSEGAYSRRPDDEALAQLSKADGRIYLGSAGASKRPAWLEGAVASAWRTVESIHKRVEQG